MIARVSFVNMCRVSMCQGEDEFIACSANMSPQRGIVKAKLTKLHPYALNYGQIRPISAKN